MPEADYKKTLNDIKYHEVRVKQGIYKPGYTDRILNEYWKRVIEETEECHKTGKNVGVSSEI